MEACGGIRTVLGTMSYSAQTAAVDAEAQLRAFVGAGFVEVDSARMYAKGGSEELIGHVCRPGLAISQQCL